MSERQGVDELMNKDMEDESLQAYKDKLLGGAKDAKPIEPDNPNLVLMREFAIIVSGEEKYTYELPASNNISLTLKQGCEYRVRLKFYVQKDLVSGLKYVNKVYRKGIKVDSSNEMVGSYAPSNDLVEWSSPIDEAPSGMIARGSYKSEITLTDDDKNIFAEFKFEFEIRKEW